MIQRERLKWEIAAQGMSYGYVADRLGMSRECFVKKLQTGAFGSQEMLDLAEVLELDSPAEVFFS